jgi:hypothetical protein
MPYIAVLPFTLIIKKVLINTVDSELESKLNKVRLNTIETPVYNNRTSKKLSRRLIKKGYGIN